MPEAGTTPHVTLWMFDFDGTLSPLVAERTAAELDPACREMLGRLAAVQGFHCAVISSRHLTDVERRVDVPGLFLGGGSGLEWKLPDGGRQAPGAERVEAVRRIREKLIPEIMEWGRLPGVEIEDKQWSLAVHIRRATPQTREELDARLGPWRQARGVRTFRGPAVIEIQLLPEVDKSLGVLAFWDLLHCPLGSARTVYAGDDENDAVAMRLVLDAGGAVITVGEKPIVAGAEVVANPNALARRIHTLAGLKGGAAL